MHPLIYLLRFQYKVPHFHSASLLLDLIMKLHTRALPADLPFILFISVTGRCDCFDRNFLYSERGNTIIQLMMLFAFLLFFVTPSTLSLRERWTRVMSCTKLAAAWELKMSPWRMGACTSAERSMPPGWRPMSLSPCMVSAEPDQEGPGTRIKLKGQLPGC